MDNKLDFAGMNAAYAKFFGTPDQPNKPARTTVQVAALVAAGALVEIEVQAARNSDATAMRHRSSALCRHRNLGAGGIGRRAIARQTPAASVFTAQQAAAGSEAYAKHCASCHMPDLSGNTEIPALAGTAFIDTWGTRSTKDLFDYSAEAMPYGAPSLSMESYIAITAYILQANGGVAGESALTDSTTVPISSVTAPQKPVSP